MFIKTPFNICIGNRVYNITVAFLIRIDKREIYGYNHYNLNKPQYKYLKSKKSCLTDI